MTTPDVHALTGPYVLDAVSDDERADFEHHLATCADCSTDVSDLRESVTKLSVYVATPPPTSLKSKVMSSILESRQLSPLGRFAPTASRKAGPPRFARRSLVLAAAFLAIAGVGVAALDQYRENTATAAVSARATTILTQPDARTIHGTVTGGGQATVVLSSRQDAAVVLVRDLLPLSGHKTYQMWLVDAEQNARSVGLIGDDPLRPTVVTGGLSGQVAFAVTIEPDGGSATPTLPPGGLDPVVPLNAATA
ncbi:anti-sigma factor [Kribbella sp. NBC_00382]|uniref:anti-sigma factor n=1 Tax=Kribbella sp. NBC_00382 TaxID=2975967 RepID=UPI002E1B242E